MSAPALLSQNPCIPEKFFHTLGYKGGGSSRRGYAPPGGGSLFSGQMNALALIRRAVVGPADSSGAVMLDCFYSLLRSL